MNTQVGPYSWLPPLVLFEDYGGNWHHYVEAIYEFFRADFITSQPRFRDHAVGVIKDPLEGSKEATFWHMTSEIGNGERIPDFRRCERIRWPRPVIDAALSAQVRCWLTKRGPEERVVLAIEDFSYVVVLILRRERVLLLTAFCVERLHRRAKLQKEYEASPKCN